MTKYNRKNFFKINKFEFKKSVVDIESIGYENIPEIVFLGSSNVGKSSLINAITSTKNLAHISKTPGKTKSINIFMSQNNQLSIADVPGYGYARVSFKILEMWNKMMHEYITKRKNLKIAFILISLQAGIKQNDIRAIELIKRNNIPYCIIITKADKNKQKEIHSGGLEVIQQQIIELKYDNNIIITSSATKDGIEEIRNKIFNAIEG